MNAVSRPDKIKTAVSGPSDLYFGCLEGSFNSDGNDRWGEPDDGPGGNCDVDLKAEVFVGRALIANSYYDSYDYVSGIYDVYNFVKKTIDYETIVDDPYLRNVLMVGDILSPSSDDGCGGELDRTKDHYDLAPCKKCGSMVKTRFNAALWLVVSYLKSLKRNQSISPREKNCLPIINLSSPP